MNSSEYNSPDQGKTAAETAREAAGDFAQSARQTASDAVEGATRATASQAESAKSSAADEVSNVASALRTAATEMRKGSPQERTFGQIAEGLADASDALREKDLSTMVEDVTRFARTNPLVFLGGAAIVGFAATRFAKASREPETGEFNPDVASTPSPTTPPRTAAMSTGTDRATSTAPGTMPSTSIRGDLT